MNYKNNTRFIKIALITIIAIMPMTSCLKRSVAPAQITTIDSFRPYSINKYTNNNVNLTTEFANYAIQFSADGQLLASKNGVSYQGAYKNENGFLTIKNFTTYPLTGLNQTWKIVSLIPAKMELTFNDGINFKELHVN